MARDKIRMSVFGTREDVMTKTSCYHHWVPCHGVIFDYITVDAHCTRCGTYWSHDSWVRGINKEKEKVMLTDRDLADLPLSYLREERERLQKYMKVGDDAVRQVDRWQRECDRWRSIFFMDRRNALHSIKAIVQEMGKRLEETSE